ncbi:MAG: DNA repair protein RecN [Acidobacteria bacterium]|nr:DNA repair protein RecN [Acidobacteriota bacterium]
MLERLEVRGLGIIDRVVVEPPRGLVALTGETGAGKSLLVESLKLLAGQRAQAEMVRTGDSLLRVEGWFEQPLAPGATTLLSELGVSMGEEGLVIRREVGASGRSRAWINDTPVTAAALQRLAPHLMAIHGQHEQYGLASPAVQRRLVDELAGHGELLGEVAAAWERWETAAGRVRELESARARRRDRLDAITFQLAEIDETAPRAGEYEELERRRLQLRNAVRIAELRAALLAGLADGEDAALDRLARAERELAELSGCGLPLGEAVQRLAEARMLVEEAIREVQGVGVEPGEGPGDLDAVESRLHRLEQLMLKYGSPLEAVLEHREALLAERGELLAIEDTLEAARRAVVESLEAYDTAASALEGSRRRAGEELLGAVAAILGRLAMAGTRLELRWEAVPAPSSPLLRDGVPVRFGPEGVEECELLIAANPGEELRPLGRIASGGELSRVHLALRTALRGRRSGGSLTLLFDEVDAGLGGGAASALGSVLEELAREDQVLVVTHLPQVAARAGAQLLVEKVPDGGRTVTRVRALGKEERIGEIARMVSGEEIGPSALEHARALLEGR